MLRLILPLAIASTSVDCGTRDPLLGTWVNTFVPTEDGEATASNTFAFASGKKVTLTVTTVYTGAAPDYASCTGTLVLFGTYVEDTSASTVSTTFASGNSSDTGCLQATQDASQVPVGSSTVALHDTRYVYGVSGSTLTLTSRTPATSVTYQNLESITPL